MVNPAVVRVTLRHLIKKGVSHMEIELEPKTHEHPPVMGNPPVEVYD